MSCKNLHESLIECGEISCPFCDIKLEDSDEKPQHHSAKYYSCCDCQDIINDNGMLVCRSCGIVQRYNSSSEYVDFYENIRKIKRKSVYHRKYHINNVLLEISSSHNITFSVQQKYKIMKIISEIGKILPQINGERKRMISVNFILRQVLKLMSVPYKKIPISKSKKTLASFQQYWTQIILLIGDEIKGIIQ